MAHTRRRNVLVILGSLALLVTLALLLRPAPPRVDVESVTRGPLEVTVDEEGETRVRERYTITAPVAGRLSRLAVREGDTVHAGLELARILPAPLDSRSREAASSRVAEAEDASRAATAQVEQARAALAQARRTTERLTDLAGRKLVSPEERERAETERDAKERELESADFRAQAAAHEVEIARAALLGDRGSAIVITAPAGGRVLQVPDRSERVVAAGTPLLEIGDVGRLEVVVDLLSSDAVRVRPGQRLRLEGWGGSPLPGRVRRVEPSGFTRVSALGVEEQRVNVRGDLDRAEPSLGDRYRVDVRIVTWAADSVLRVPVSALFRAGEGWAVFVADRGGRVSQRPVRLGQRGSKYAEVLGGLSSGDLVIPYPGDRIRPGVRVRPR